MPFGLLGHKEDEAVLEVLKDGKARTTFEIAEELMAFSTDLNAQHVYVVLMFRIRDKVYQPQPGKFALRKGGERGVV